MTVTRFVQPAMNEHLEHFPAAIEFLSRDRHANRELLLALQYEPVTALHVAFVAGAPTGVLVQGPGPFNPDPDWIRLDAGDETSVDELIQRISLDARLIVSVHRPWMTERLRTAYGLHPTGAGVYGYLIDRTQYVPPAQGTARLLTLDDIGLVERSACGWTRSYFERLFDEARHPWAIIRDGEIVCRASSGYCYADTEEVVGVWTHPQWRGRGLAQAIVRAVTADILQRFPYAAYTTTYDNQASQAVARAVGFQRCFAAASLQRIAED